MSNQQRKAMFARINNTRLKRSHPLQDADRDGVVNSKDCQPLNPKRQGFLHKLTIRRLKKKEERVEQQREKEQKKLNDLRDELGLRNKITAKKVRLKRAELKQKQAVIEELNDEKSKLATVKRANEDAKRELDKFTFKGKVKRVSGQLARSTFDKSKRALSAAEERWNLPENVEHRKRMKKSAGKTLRRIGKKLNKVEL